MRSLLYSLLLVATSLPILVYGQGKVYSPLVNIPGNGANGFEEYISFLYGASISIAALLAVVKIIIAGAKYMLSDIVTNKGEALSDIQGAILGLLLILGAVIILEFINPQLIKREIKFQTIAPPPTINARNSAVAVAEQRAAALLAGLDPCAQPTQSLNQAGTSNLTTINVSNCGDIENKRRVLNEFAADCATQGGRSYNNNVNGVPSDRATCEIPIENGAAIVAATRAAQTELYYIKRTFWFGADLEGDGTNTKYFLTNDYISLSGNSIVMNIGGFCNATISVANTPNLSILQRRNLLDNCTAETGGRGLIGPITGRCQVVDAKTSLNGGTLTCQMPVARIPATDLKVSDPQSGGDRPPKDWNELVSVCNSLGGNLYKSGGIVYQWMDWNDINLSDYTCIDYN